MALPPSFLAKKKSAKPAGGKKKKGEGMQSVLATQIHKRKKR